MNVPFCQYRDWLKSPEYKAQIAALVGTPNDPPRSKWPVNVSELIARHEAHATMCIEAAARHMREANALAARQEARDAE